MDNYLSFDDKDANPHPYFAVFMISIPLAKAKIPKVLFNTESSLNILLCQHTEMDRYSTSLLIAQTKYGFKVERSFNWGKSADQAHYWVWWKSTSS